MDNVDKIENAIRGVELDIRIDGLGKRLSEGGTERTRERVATYLILKVQQDPTMQRRINEANQRGGQDEIIAELDSILRESLTIGGKDFDIDLFNMAHEDDDEIVLQSEWVNVEKDSGEVIEISD